MKPQEPEPDPVQVRRVEPRDMDALLTIERQCFNVYYYGYYMLDRRDFEFYRQDDESLFLVAVQAGQVVGYVLGPVEIWRAPPSAHIDSIAVLPEAQGKGIGHRLLQSFLSGARRQGCTRVTLEVSTANKTGLAFFLGHGFRGIRQRPDYYGKGLPALLMAVEVP